MHSLADLYDVHAGILYAFLLSLTLSRAESEDIRMVCSQFEEGIGGSTLNSVVGGESDNHVRNRQQARLSWR
jgi:hypothetical protein